MSSEPESRIRVLIVDDHTIVRQGLRTLLELMPDIQVVGEAPDGQAAVAMAGDLKPDVVLMDLMMPVMDGILATRLICQAGLPIRVIALTSFQEDENVIPAIRAGATSFLLKDVSPSDLVEAIRAASRGEARLHPNVTRKLMDQVASAPKEEFHPHDSITGRELEVLRLVSKGLSNRDIAKKLVISEKTVKTHVSSLLGKLDLQDRTQLAIYAYRKGIVPED